MLFSTNKTFLPNARKPLPNARPPDKHPASTKIQRRLPPEFYTLRHRKHPPPSLHDTPPQYEIINKLLCKFYYSLPY